MNAINNLNELDSFGDLVDRAIDAAKDKAADAQHQELLDFTDQLVEMTYAETIESMELQPNMVARAISVLAFKAGYKVGILPF